MQVIIILYLKMEYFNFIQVIDLYLTINLHCTYSFFLKIIFFYLFTHLFRFLFSQVRIYLYSILFLYIYSQGFIIFQHSMNFKLKYRIIILIDLYFLSFIILFGWDAQTNF